jgi:hypothetical protein
LSVPVAWRNLEIDSSLVLSDVIRGLYVCA